MTFGFGGHFEDMGRQGVMAGLQRLERFWHGLVSEQKLTLGTEVNGAVIACWPEIPSFRLNHAADIDVTEQDAEVLVSRVTEYFLSRGVLSFGFRVSPLTRPRQFVSILERRGFDRKDEDSVMVFRGERPGDIADSAVDIREIDENDIDTFSQVSVTAYETLSEWKGGFDRLFLQRIQRGGRHYLDHVGGVPVGTCALLSSARTGGIFSVGTLKEYRGKGIATAMTLRAVRDSFDEGNILHTLQAERSGHAERLYRRMGFEIDHTVAYFVKTVSEWDGVHQQPRGTT
jgi:GNAT superfamily N-acetyltransferase